jgi:hypothetical protein
LVVFSVQTILSSGKVALVTIGRKDITLKVLNSSTLSWVVRKELKALTASKVSKSRIPSVVVLVLAWVLS